LEREIDMTTTASFRVPPHVPQALVLDADPWQSGEIQPHDWLVELAGGEGFRYCTHNPLGPVAGEGCWIALGAKEVRAILIDNKNFVSRDSTGVGKLIGEDLVLAPLESDAPDHMRLRGILQPCFQPQAVKAYTSRIRTLALQLIGDVTGDGRCEFIRDFAVKLPTQIFLEIIGLPLADLPQFLEWEDIVMGRSEPERMAETWLKIRDYLEQAIDERRASPRDDILTRMITQTAQQAVDPEGEALGMALILLVAGLDTVVTALGWHFKYLAEHPEEQERLRRDPALIPAAVDEMLRAFSFTTLLRTAARDVELFGVKFKAGDKIVCPTVLGSRDADDYADPARVDFDRGAMRHLAFGFGQHICIGMHLARLELITAIECWLAEAPTFRIPNGYRPSWHGGVSLGLDALELEW
jgi:Cytochrome P450